MIFSSAKIHQWEISRIIWIIIYSRIFCGIRIFEINTIVQHHSFKLGKRFVDKLLHQSIRRKSDLIMPFYQYTFSCIDIHTLTIIDIDNLECT